MRRAFAVLCCLIVVVGCGGQETRYPTRPATQEAKVDPNDPIVSGKPLSSWLKDLKSNDSETRREAAVFLGNKGATYAIQPLVAALKDQDPQVRVAAARSLRTIGKDTKESLPALIAALKDPDDKVKIAVADAVTDYRYDAVAAVPALVEMYQHPDNTVRASAGRALNHIDVDAARKAGVPAP